MNEAFIMHPGDTFVAEECGCSFTVESGPNDERMVRQAPQCCCGHEMKRQGAPMMAGAWERNNRSMTGSDYVEQDMFNGAPAAMPD